MSTPTRCVTGVALFLLMFSPSTMLFAQDSFLEAEAMDFDVQGKLSTNVQPMRGFGKGWHGDAQRFADGEVGSSLILKIPVQVAGAKQLDVYMTLAPDFGKLKFYFDEKPIGEVFNGYEPRVVASGRIALGKLECTAATHTLRLEVVGKDERSSGYKFGVDGLTLGSGEKRDVAVNAAVGPGKAGDDTFAYFDVPLKELKITAGEFPDPNAEVIFPGRMWGRRWDVMLSTVVLNVPGEGFIAYDNDRDWAFPQFINDPQNSGRLLIRAPQEKDVSGQFTVPKRDGSGMNLIKFTVPASAGKPSARESFFSGKLTYYRRLQWRNSAGGAWFRHQADEAQRELSKSANRDSQQFDQFNWQSTDPTNAYALFSGGRAISENMQLNRTLRPTRDKAAAATVDVASLQGITVAEINWKPLLKDVNPKLDPLAKRIPADQHVVFFPTFNAVVAMADELGGSGNPDLMRMAEPRSENANTQKQYERQLGLSMSTVGRLLGPTMIGSVAITGSDPYFRVGTDVAVLFETANPEVFAPLLLAKIQLAADADAKPQSGTVAGVSYSGFRTPDRRVCSYVAQLPGAVVITNSLTQLERLASVGDKAPAIDSLDEYKFFRTRYPLGDATETAFVFLSDATIRRWCSAKWRIATARRTFAAAALAELTAQNVLALDGKSTQTKPLHSDIALVDGGELSLAPSGVLSSTLGGLTWMTPIAELPIEKVTPEEADAYNQWREGYQRNWRWAFDPLAVRLGLNGEKWSADLTVMPLIAGTEYREMIAVSRGAEIKPGAGDRHDALVHIGMSINTDSMPLRDAGNFISTMAPGFKVNPLGWLGSSVSLYVDDDPLWQEWREQTGDKRSEFEHRVVSRLPIALNAEVSDPLKLTLFLTSLRAFAEQTAPGMVTWESLTYHDQPYVKIKPTERAQGMLPTEEITIYYAPSPGGLIVTLNEAVLKRALDRAAKRDEAKKKPDSAETAKKEETGAPWLGKNFCVQVDRKMFDILSSTRAFDFDTEQVMQARSWSNLPILNEWKRLFPDQNPVDVHERLWGTRLVCPGGGEYAWNNEWKTMESSVYGHPGQPKTGPSVPTALDRFLSGNFGLTFEDQGLRARVDLTRSPAKK